MIESDVPSWPCEVDHGTLKANNYHFHLMHISADFWGGGGGGGRVTVKSYILQFGHTRTFRKITASSVSGVCLSV